MMVKLRVCVVGAGNIGLGSAICVQEMLEQDLRLRRADYSLDVVSESFSPNVTSDVAAGFWEPYVDRVSRHDLHTLSSWGRLTWDYFTKLWTTGQAAECGLQMVSGYILTDPGAPLPFEWKDIVLDFHEMTESELKMFPGYKAGFGFTSFLCEQMMYLRYLTKQLADKGVNFVQKRVNKLSELCADYDLVVNCTGVGAKALVDDTEVKPIRGQVIRVKAPWAKQFVMDSTSSGQATFPKGYILPNVNFCVLGGSHEVDDWDLAPRQDVTTNILQSCAKLVPGIEKSEILEVKCGLRPGRCNVRLETEKVQDSWGNSAMVVHNYGHGGIGVTLQMGTCRQAADLAKSCLQHVAAKSKL